MLHFPVTTVSGFTPARAWSLGYGDAPRIPLVADVQGNGTSAIVSVNSAGEGSIDIDLGTTGLKASGGVTALSNFGKNIQAAATGVVTQDGKASIFGLCGGDTINLASGFANGHLQLSAGWVKLPAHLDTPKLAFLPSKNLLLAFSPRSDIAYEIDPLTKAVNKISVPRTLVWIGDLGDAFAAQTQKGMIYRLDASKFRLQEKFGAEPIDYFPAALSGMLVYKDRVWTSKGTVSLPPSPYPDSPTVYQLGIDNPKGNPALFEFRKDNLFHRGGLVLKRWGIPKEDPDSDLALAALKDSSNDGLLDVWKTNGFRGLDLKKLGCTPGHADVVCLISRFDDVDQKFVDSEMVRIIKFYADLKVPNPDGTSGIRFHPIFLDPISGNDRNNPWWANRDKFLPAKWRGVVHWMQITNGGGGQADELSNGGTCGVGALWAVFVHEFGHQLGLNHEGFMDVGASPIYTSLMNYTWSYGFEESRDKVHYSDGSLSSLQLHENDLDETLPFPYEKVKFLSLAPYHFRMKPDGSKTLIDWNWDGVFGEKHVKANITYAYSISAGERDNVGKTKTAPWLFVHQKSLYALYGTNDLPVDLKVQPTLSPTRPGRLVLKKMISPTHWERESIIEPSGVIGDPVAISLGERIACIYPTVQGLRMRVLETDSNGIHSEKDSVLATESTLVPSIGENGRDTYLFDWNPSSHEVGYRVIARDGTAGARFILDVPSSNPIGMAADSIRKEAVIGLSQDQPNGKTNRWQIRRYRSAKGGTLVADGPPDWVEGEKGGARGTGRLTILFDSSRDAGPLGRTYLFGKGITDDKSPWACSYVAQQIADKSYNGGWIVKRYYDEWSQTRSAPAAVWFAKDIAFAYRWTAGDQSETDNNFHLGFHGLGVDSGTMTDFDDLDYIRSFGLANSLLNLDPITN